MELVNNSNATCVSMQLCCPVDFAQYHAVQICQEKHPGKIAGELLGKIYTMVSEFFYGIDDQEKMRTMLRNDPHNLRFASLRLRDDERVVLSVIKRDAMTLQYVTPRLQRTQKVVFAALKQNRKAIMHVDFQMVEYDAEMFLKLIQRAGFRSKVAKILYHTFKESEGMAREILFKTAKAFVVRHLLNK